MDLFEHLHELRDQYLEARAEAVSTARAMAELSVTASDEDKVVQLTMDAGGRVTAVELQGTKYRKLPRTALEQAIAGAFERASTELQAKRLEHLPASPFEGVSTEDLMSGKVDWTDVLPADLEMPDPSSARRPTQEQAEGWS